MNPLALRKFIGIIPKLRESKCALKFSAEQLKFAAKEDKALTVTFKPSLEAANKAKSNCNIGALRLKDAKSGLANLKKETKNLNNEMCKIEKAFLNCKDPTKKSELAAKYRNFESNYLDNINILKTKSGIADNYEFYIWVNKM